jgi:hypothetical protein
MKDWQGDHFFNGSIGGSPAMIRYLCEGPKATGGTIKAQIIWIDHPTETLAKSEYGRQTQILETHHGKPCWDLSQPSGTQHLPPSDKPPRPTTWKLYPDIWADIVISQQPNLDPAVWRVAIMTFRLSTESERASMPESCR